MSRRPPGSTRRGAVVILFCAALAGCAVEASRPTPPDRSRPMEIARLPAGAADAPASRAQALARLAEIEAGRPVEPGYLATLDGFLQKEFHRALEPAEKIATGEALARAAVLRADRAGEAAWYERCAALARRSSPERERLGYLTARAYARAGRAAEALDLCLPSPALQREDPELDRLYTRLADAIAAGGPTP
ncbi:MAG: hypothetical protein HY719_16825 [Planctomycetes bacterium]|nr:hypothetical protein [Planctomycetota bacterium]